MSPWLSRLAVSETGSDLAEVARAELAEAQNGLAKTEQLLCNRRVTEARAALGEVASQLWQVGYNLREALRKRPSL